MSDKKSPIESKSNRAKEVEKVGDQILSQNLWLKILIGMGLGLGAGLILSPQTFHLIETDDAFALGEWLAVPGVIFLGLIKMVIIPLVVCSIILGISDSGDIGMVKRLGTRLVPYFIVTTIISVSIGVFLVQTIEPGKMIDQNLVQATMQSGAAADRLPGETYDDLTIPQRIANIIPTNLARAELEQNMLQIIIASIFAGIALLSIPRKTGKAFSDLCLAGQMISLKIIGWAMGIAPYAVFGLLCNITIRIGLEAISSVGVYMLTVVLGLLCMMGVYLAVVRFVTGKSVFGFLANIREVQLLAFSTSSSAATMPFTIQAAEEKLNIRSEIARFVVPLGATINMDGTALYQAIAALFLCQVFGIELSAGETILLILTTVGASIGTPATPGVGIIVLATILSGIGVPVEGIALIIGVDRLLDMCRTTINVTGDLTASTVMNKIVPKM